jgi:hypothetical protein
VHRWRGAQRLSVSFGLSIGFHFAAVEAHNPIVAQV